MSVIASKGGEREGRGLPVKSLQQSHHSYSIGYSSLLKRKGSIRGANSIAQILSKVITCRTTSADVANRDFVSKYGPVNTLDNLCCTRFSDR